MDSDVLNFFGVMMAIVVAGGFGYAIVTGIQAMSRRLSGQAGPQALELEELRDRVANLETTQERLAELEERLDFAERLLSQRNDPARIDARGGG